MSYEYNYKFWVATSEELKNFLLKQEAFKQLKPIEDRSQAHETFAEVYAEYVQLVNKLSYIYNQINQVQKRDLVKRLLEAATKRMLELRNELKNIELSEFIYLDKTLVQLKLIPEDLQLIRPHYFPMIRSDEIEKLIYGPEEEEIDSDNESDEYFSQLFDKSRAEPSFMQQMSTITAESTIDRIKTSRSLKLRKQFLKTQIKIKLTPEQQRLRQAVLLIQAHERARRSRVLYFNIKYDPDKYGFKQSKGEPTCEYTFTHRPGQSMLIPIKRTKFEYNFYEKPKPLEQFNYYTKKSYSKPEKKISRKLLQKPDDSRDDTTVPKDKSKQGSTTEDGYRLSEQASFFEEFYNNDIHLIEFVTDNETRYAEDYFLKNMFAFYNNVEIRAPSTVSFIEQSTMISESTLLLQRQESAAIKIQRMWRRYRASKRLKDHAIKRKLFYGMLDIRKPKKNLYKDLKFEQLRNQRKRELFDKQFAKAVEDEKTRILKIKGPWIMEDISDHIRAWLREFYDAVKDFPRYPEEFEDGTILLLRGEAMTVQDYLNLQKEKMKSKEQKKKEAEKRKQEKLKLLEKLKKEKAAAAKEKALQKKKGLVSYDLAAFSENQNVQELQKIMTEYEKEWAYINELKNKKEDPYMHWITLDKFAEVHIELRKVVDKLMRIEFELLRQALAKDKKKKYKPQKPKKQKKSKRKKSKKKEKKVKDLTENRSIQSLYFEMKQDGLIKPLMASEVDDFIGDYNYAAYEIRNFMQKDSEPSVGEVKTLIRECLLGMGPLNLPKPKSVCIAGLLDSGRHSLLKLMAEEIDAVVIDISPENVIKFENNIPYFIHLINKMARILQPTILFIENAHRLFWKKVPPQQSDINPRLLGKHIIKKIIKPIKPEDKVLVVGTTDSPWQAKGAKFKKCFDKFILIPKMDYGTSFLLWRNKILSKFGVPRDFEFSPLSLVTRNYLGGAICKNVEQTLNIKRRMNLLYKPLTSMEFLDTFLEGPEPLFPPKENDYNKFIKWFRQVNKLAKERGKYLKQLEEIKNRNESSKNKKEKK